MLMDQLTNASKGLPVLRLNNGLPKMASKKKLIIIGFASSVGKQANR